MMQVVMALLDNIVRSLIILLEAISVVAVVDVL